MNERGRTLEARLRRTVDRLDSKLSKVSPGLWLLPLSRNCRLRSRCQRRKVSCWRLALGLAQPTVHRAITLFQQEAGRSLFERISFGLVATKPCREIAQTARIAFAEFNRREVGSIRIGALPLSRSYLLPEAIVRFRRDRPQQTITVIDGTYKEMLAGLRSGDIGFIVGALRSPLPVEDEIQERLLCDHLVVVVRPDHPLEKETTLRLDVLVQHPWVVPRPDTPTREQFDQLFDSQGMAMPDSVVECGSILLIRELLSKSELLGCISKQQVKREVNDCKFDD